jgi:hypothetical protein
VGRAAAFTRWLFGRSKFTAPPPSPLSGARAALEIVIGAPTLPVDLTASPSGEHIRDYLLARRRGVRTHLYAQTVLRIPPIGTPLLTGRRFRAARTNNTRARREGITCRELPEAERPRVLRELDQPASLVGRALDRWWVAEGSDRSSAGFALATVDRKWALLNWLIAPRYTARYLLHAHLVEALQAAGVRYLATRTPMALVQSPGALYLQARLGYEIVRLRVAPERL